MQVLRLGAGIDSDDNNYNDFQFAFDYALTG